MADDQNVDLHVAPEGWGEWMRKHLSFGTLLVFLFAVLVYVSALAVIWHGASDRVIQWLEQKDNLVTGAFIGMVTGGVAGIAIGRSMK